MAVPWANYGPWSGVCSYTVDEFKQQGIETGKQAELEFLSGVRVSGQLRNIVRSHQRNLIFIFDNCTITALGGECPLGPGRSQMCHIDPRLREMAASGSPGQATVINYGLQRFGLRKQPRGEASTSP